MTIQIHDSLTRELTPLQPLTPGEIGMYVCGPTVYSDSHIGHLMGPVIFDNAARWLRARGHEVRFVLNITDIDDKIINRAIETGEEWTAVAELYTQQFLDLIEELGVDTITDHPRCTEYVPKMITFIEELIDRGMAYETSDGVYFEVEKHEGYGKLSGRVLDDMQAGARIEVGSELHHPGDFALWKKAKPGEPTWDSPWGPGRPGWHIECSVMSSDLLGGRFDIHGGGDDLKFPHHENEIAQSEAHGDEFANLWMHNGLIQYGGRKVSKSDPRMQDPEFSRQFQARWLIDTYGAAVLRFFLIRSSYRRPIDFEPKNLGDARKGLTRLLKLLGERLEAPAEASLEEILARDLPEEVAERRARFCAAMDDDFGTGEAVAELFTLAKIAGEAEGAAREKVLLLMRDLGRLLGLMRPGDLGRLGGTGGGDERLGAVAEVLLALRRSAREARDFATADGLRDLITAQGIGVLDGAEGSTCALDDAKEGALAALVDGALGLRREARERKDFGTSDAIRDGLVSVGVLIHDGPEGSSWELG